MFGCGIESPKGGKMLRNTCPPGKRNSFIDRRLRVAVFRHASFSELLRMAVINPSYWESW